MTTPLDGIRVVDLTTWAFGPQTARHLGDMGAEVIKVEDPVVGDGARGMEALQYLPKAKYLFELENRNKKGIAVDLKKPEGKEIIYRLVERADVFVTNLPTQVLKRLNVDYEAISRVNPKIVYGLASGWGLNGPLKDRRAYDWVVFARSGLSFGLGEPGTPPVSCLPAMGDHIAAVTLAYGIMVALFHRQRTGVGQMVHASLLGSLANAGSMVLQACLTTKQAFQRVSRKLGVNPLSNTYQTKDGRWLQLCMPQSDLYWDAFCQALDIKKEVKDDPRFASHRSRGDNNIALTPILEEIFATKTLAEWADLLEAHNIIWGPVANYEEVPADPQLWENGYIVKFDHPSAGPINVAGIPVQLSKTPGAIRTPSPEHGQHTEEVLLESGYSWEQIAELKDKKVII